MGTLIKSMYTALFLACFALSNVAMATNAPVPMFANPLEEKISAYELHTIAEISAVPSSTLEVTIEDEINGNILLTVSFDANGNIINADDSSNSQEKIDTYKKKRKPGYSKSPSTPTKTNGGTNKKDFINEHAYDRHKYNPDVKSTSSKTQYGKHINVKELRLQTMDEPDLSWRTVDKSGVRCTYYAKKFVDNISTTDTKTKHHRVIINHTKPDRSTQFPLYAGRDE